MAPISHLNGPLHAALRRQSRRGVAKLVSVLLGSESRKCWAVVPCEAQLRIRQEKRLGRETRSPPPSHRQSDRRVAPPRTQRGPVAEDPIDGATVDRGWPHEDSDQHDDSATPQAVQPLGGQRAQRGQHGGRGRSASTARCAAADWPRRPPDRHGRDGGRPRPRIVAEDLPAEPAQLPAGVGHLCRVGARGGAGGRGGGASTRAGRSS